MYEAMKIVPENYVHYQILATQQGQSHLFWNGETPTWAEYIILYPRDDFGYQHVEFLNRALFLENFEPVDVRAFEDHTRYYAVIPRR